MSDVKSKNLYELLGNTSDQDSDREPDPPTKVVDKPTPRAGKRDAPEAAPTEPQGNTFVAREGRGGRGGRRGEFRGSEGAFQDRDAGRSSNRGRPTGPEEGDRPGRTFGQDSRVPRGNRGARRYDRHSRTGQTEHQKQADLGWGANTGEAEFADEKAGEKIAEEEVKAEGWGAADDSGTPAAPVNDSAVATWDGGDGGAPGFKDAAAPTDGGNGETAPAADPEAEPEDTHKSYAEYLAEQAAKKMEGLGLLQPREANEGSKQDKKWQNAKEIAKSKEEGYIPGVENKGRRERDRTRNAPEKLEIDYSFKEERRGGGEGGRGRGRGRGERGEFRGRGRGRGDYGDRAEGGQRGDREGGYRGGDREGGGGGYRGDREGGYRGRGEGYRGRGERGEFRGRGRGRGGDRGSGEAPAVAVNDEAAFPSLGGGKK